MKPLTGRKILAIGLTAFAIIFAPNLILAYYASQTFSGLVVANSYVASQEFDIRTRAQEALGWTASLDHADGQLDLAFHDAEGRPVRPATLDVTVGRPTTANTDRQLELVHTVAGYTAPAILEPGRWIVRIEATAPDGTVWSQRHGLHIKPET